MAEYKSYPLWVSHSSINDFLSCPRAYYLRHVYKDPKTGRKINIINPAMALGLTVHEVLESLANYKAEERMQQPLLENYEKAWEHVSGEMGGFRDEDEEKEYKERGRKMIQRVVDHPGVLLNKTVRLPSPDELPPRFFISKEENVLLCGKVDWLEYFPEDDSVHIVDFKTGVKEEKEDSLQLPIYTLLVKNLQRRNIRELSYWYLERDDAPVEKELPDLEAAAQRIVEVAKQIKQLKSDGRYVCLRRGCFACKPLENVLNGRAKWIKQSGYMDVYVNID
jgi:ATP-dependent helicase/DNAse subunit B